MSCLLCKEQTEADGDKYCQVHTRALESLTNAYTTWKSAYGHISITDYLDRVIKLPSTGEKSREVAKFLRENPSRWE